MLGLQENVVQERAMRQPQVSVESPVTKGREERVESVELRGSTSWRRGNESPVGSKVTFQRT